MDWGFPYSVAGQALCFISQGPFKDLLNPRDVGWFFFGALGWLGVCGTVSRPGGLGYLCQLKNRWGWGQHRSASLAYQCWQHALQWRWGWSLRTRGRLDAVRHGKALKGWLSPHRGWFTVFLLEPIYKRRGRYGASALGLAFDLCKQILERSEKIFGDVKSLVSREIIRIKGKLSRQRRNRSTWAPSREDDGRGFPLDFRGVELGVQRCFVQSFRQMSFGSRYQRGADGKVVYTLSERLAKVQGLEYGVAVTEIR